MVAMITANVKKGEPVKIPNLGGWKKRKSAARMPQPSDRRADPDSGAREGPLQCRQEFKQAVLGK
jgi:hypothetical protein